MFLRITQIFAAMVVYLSLFQSAQAASCPVQNPSIPQSECEALVAIYESTDGPNWTDQLNWNTTADPCTWQDVRCSIVDGVNSVSFLRRQNIGMAGQIPVEIGNLSNLQRLQLWQNSELTGSIPAEIGNLTNLSTLWLPTNGLTGSIPEELGNLTRLRTLNLSSNDLSGDFPPRIGNLTNLSRLELHFNELSGELPEGISDATALKYLNLSHNDLTGTIPSGIGNLLSLEELDLGGNRFDGSFPVELANLSLLESLDLASGNRLTGEIPVELMNLVNLKVLNLAGNNMSGSIPSEISNLAALEYLDLGSMGLSGSIPATIGDLSNLKSLRMTSNELSGPIPAEIGNLTNLTTLFLGGNQLTAIPPEIGLLQSLTSINLANNMLSGSIPGELFNLHNLIDVSVPSNLLSGPLPGEIGNAVNLEILNVSNNMLTGPIPSEITNLQNLHSILFENNNLSGPIASEFGLIPSLIQVRLAHNQLSGEIPSTLSNLIRDDFFTIPLRGNGCLTTNDERIVEFLNAESFRWTEGCVLTAENDVAETSEGVSVSVPVLDNDTVVDAVATVRVASLPDGGAATVQPDGSILFTPDNGFNGVTSFDYFFTRLDSTAARATVTVTVTALNEQLVAQNDSVSTNEDESVLIDVLANDSSVDAEALNLSIETTPAHGTVSVGQNRTVTFTPNNDFNGVDSFVYSVDDGNNQSATATVFIEIVPVNDAPVAANDSIFTDENIAVEIDVLANDEDLDSETLEVLISVSPSNGTATVSNGIINYVPVADYSGIDDFTYSLNDGSGGTSTATVTVTVNAVEVIEVEPTGNIDGSSPVSVNEWGSGFNATFNYEITASDTAGGVLREWSLQILTGDSIQISNAWINSGYNAGIQLTGGAGSYAIGNEGQGYIDELNTGDVISFTIQGQGSGFAGSDVTLNFVSLTQTLPLTDQCENPSPISLPFAFDGQGTHCWEVSGTVSNVNSWNTESVLINGESYSNRWSNSLPPRVDGKYLIRYNAAVPWSHFEISGSN